jgi:hypothetical protein
MVNPYRLRSQRYLAFIRGKPCLKCGDAGEAHHITYAQPRAMALKSGDQWAVPLCHRCHMALHDYPSPERTWWALNGIDPVIWAKNSFQTWSREYGALPDIRVGTVVNFRRSTEPKRVEQSHQLAHAGRGKETGKAVAPDQRTDATQRDGDTE